MSPRAGLAAALALLSLPAAARTLTVGQGKEYGLPSEAVRAAQDGDTILISPGEYFDCAIVGRNRLTIAGDGDGAAITDKTCEGKGLLVLRGNDVTIRNLALRRARVPDANGAGIRLESPNLTVDHVHFDNDQVGVLSGYGGGTVTITDSVFDRGGVGGPQAKFAIMIGQSALLRVTNCTFSDGKGGQIDTAAARSELVGNTIGAGTGDAEEEPANAVLATDGALLMERNVITVGPLAPRGDAAIGVWDGATAVIRQNQMINKTGQSLALVKDWSWGSPVLQDNRVGAGDTLVSSSGAWRHRASNEFRARKDQARALAGDAKQLVKRLLGR